MAALNSFTLATQISSLPQNIVFRETSTRVLGRKGIFIIPYDINRKVAWVKLRSKMLASVNDYSSDWVQPVLGFFGYVWPRKFKSPIGNPVQINAEQQVLFSWFSESNYEHLMYYSYLLQVSFQTPTSEFESIGVLTNPDITDFSFALQREGRIEVTCEIGYWNPALWGDDPANAPTQDFFDPDQVADTPPPGNQRPPEAPPITEPYRPDNDDFGEGLPGLPLPPIDQPEDGNWRYGYSTSFTNPQTGLEEQRGTPNAASGQLPIFGIGNPVAVLGTGIRVTIVDANGSTAYTMLVSGGTQAELDEMVENWQFTISYF